ncbi:MAG: plasmid pRiA4b ORF-3 family protein [Candidatus Nanopelagicales bacterium]
MTQARTRWNPVMSEVFAAPGVPWWVMAGAEAIRAWEPVVPVEAEQVVFPVAWLLRRVGPGVRLTQAGYLPPAVVGEALAAGLADRIGSSRREVDVYELGQLRALCVRMRLLRPVKGTLTVTKLGQRLVEDPIGLWWHLADCLPADRDRFPRHQAGLELLSLLVPFAEYELDHDGFGSAAWRARGRRLDEALGVCWATSDGRRATHQWTETGGLLHLLGLAGDESWRGRGRAPIGRAAAVAFARAALTRPAVAVPDPTSPGPVDALEVLVSLTGTEPLVWRRLVVPASITLGRLHHVLQGAMGWTDSHLHLFRVAGRLVGPVDLDLGVGPSDDEDAISLGQVTEPGSVIGYEYDFGDSWEHTVEVLAARPGHLGRTLAVVAGERACPPEDVGGIGGHEQLCQVLAGHAVLTGLDPEQVADLVAWAPEGYDPAHFDVEQANHRIAIALSDDELAKLQQAIEQR